MNQAKNQAVIFNNLQDATTSINEMKNIIDLKENIIEDHFYSTVALYFCYAFKNGTFSIKQENNYIKEKIYYIEALEGDRTFYLVEVFETAENTYLLKFKIRAYDYRGRIIVTIINEPIFITPIREYKSFNNFILFRDELLKKFDYFINKNKNMVILPIDMQAKINKIMKYLKSMDLYNMTDLYDYYNNLGIYQNVNN